MLIVTNAECHILALYAECRYVEFRYAVARFSKLMEPTLLKTLMCHIGVKYSYTCSINLSESSTCNLSFFPISESFFSMIES